MSAKWKVPGVNYFTIATRRDLMGINDWKVYLVDLAAGTVTDETSHVSIDEIVVTIDNPAQVHTASAVSAGSRAIVLNSGDGANISSGMKLAIPSSVGTEYHEVKRVNGDTVLLYRKLKGDVDANAEINQVGNTGDYKVAVDSEQISTTLIPGEAYQVQVQSASAGIDVTSNMFHIVSYDENDLGDDIAYIKDQLDGIANRTSTEAEIYI